MQRVVEGVLHERGATEAEQLLAEIVELRRRIARVEGRFFSPTSEQIIADLVRELIGRGSKRRVARAGEPSR